MLLRNSISNTKKFFQKTLGSFMSFLYPGGEGRGRVGSYQRLPKTPPFNRGRTGIDMEHMQTRYEDSINNNKNNAYKESEDSILDQQRSKHIIDKKEERDAMKKTKKKMALPDQPASTLQRRKKKEANNKATLNFDQKIRGREAQISTINRSNLEETRRRGEMVENRTRHVRLCWLAQRFEGD